MITKRGHTRKLNLGNYESADFWAEGDEWQEVMEDVKKQIFEYQADTLRESLKTRIQLLKENLGIYNRDKEANKLKINEGKFMLDLLTSELEMLTKPTQK